jgi:hypothetical protein
MKGPFTEDGAMTAAGVPKPEPATMDAFIGALSVIAGTAPTGVGHWNVTLAEIPKGGHQLVTARIQQKVTT